MNLMPTLSTLLRAAETETGSAAPDAAAVTAPVETPATPEVPAASEAPDYSWMGKDYVVDGKPDFDRFKTDHEELLAESTRRKEALADVPEDGNYDFTVPADLDYGDIKLPDGMTIELKANDPVYQPLFGELGAFLKENNLPKSAAGKITGLLAKYEAAKVAGNYAALTKDAETLGPNEAARAARISRIDRALDTKLPKDQAEALKAFTSSAASARALEALLFPNGGGSSTSVTAAKAADPLAARYPKSA